jgi:hypothetical protein
VEDEYDKLAVRPFLGFGAEDFAQLREGMLSTLFSLETTTAM